MAHHLKSVILLFYTDDPVHIYLLEDYVWHDVLVNRLVRRSQDDLEQWITAERNPSLWGNKKDIQEQIKKFAY